MTEKNTKEEKTYLKDFINHRKDLESMDKVAKAVKDSRSKINESGEKDLKKTAFAFAKKYNIPLDESQIDEEGINQIFQQAQKLASIQYSDILYEHADSIIDKEIGASKLEKLAAEENIFKATSGDDKKVIGKYIDYSTFKDFAEEYIQTGKLKIPSEEEADDYRKKIGVAAIEGLVAEVKKTISKSSKAEQRIAEGLARYIVAKGYISQDNMRKYASKGLKENVKKLHDEYKKAGDVSKIVGNTLKKMIKGDSEQFNIAGALIYSVATEKSK